MLGLLRQINAFTYKPEAEKEERTIFDGSEFYHLFELGDIVLLLSDQFIVEFASKQFDASCVFGQCM